jgi:hypothetical protein
MPANTCASCNGKVSTKAYDCPHCGHPIRKPKRGFFGFIFKWLLIIFNLLMIAWLLSYWSKLGEMTSSTMSSAEQAGAAIGGTLGTGLLFGIWVVGDIILGLATLLTRARK